MNNSMELILSGIGVSIPIAASLIYLGKSQGVTTTEIKGIREDIGKLTKTMENIYTIHKELRDETNKDKEELIERIHELELKINIINLKIDTSDSKVKI